MERGSPPIWSCCGRSLPRQRRLRKPSGGLLPRLFTLTASREGSGGILSAALVFPRLMVRGIPLFKGTPCSMQSGLSSAGQRTAGPRKGPAGHPPGRDCPRTTRSLAYNITAVGKYASAYPLFPAPFPPVRPVSTRARGSHAGALAPPPAPPGAPWPGGTRASDRKTCCKINACTSRFFAESACTYFATACRKGQDNRVVPPRFSFPLHPLSSLLLAQDGPGKNSDAGLVMHCKNGGAGGFEGRTLLRYTPRKRLFRAFARRAKTSRGF